VALCLEGLAALATGEAERGAGPRERPARLLGAAEALRAAAGAPVRRRNQALYDLTTAAARGLLEEEAFGAAWRAGRAMSLEEAVAYALSENTPASLAEEREER
jgi:hypothetical protein